MEKGNPLATPKSFFRILIDPTELRLIASRMEAESKNTMRGQEIEYPLTNSIVFVYEPQTRKSENEHPQLIEVMQ